MKGGPVEQEWKLLSIDPERINYQDQQIEFAGREILVPDNSTMCKCNPFPHKLHLFISFLQTEVYPVSVMGSVERTL